MQGFRIQSPRVRVSKYCCITASITTPNGRKLREDLEDDMCDKECIHKEYFVHAVYQREPYRREAIVNDSELSSIDLLAKKWVVGDISLSIPDILFIFFVSLLP